MTVLLDTSAILASLLEHHANHGVAITWFAQQEKGVVNLAMCQHSIAELYSVLTGSPPPIRVSPATAAKLIGGLRIDVVELTKSQYFEAIARISAGRLSGGVLYDMLHLIAAEACGADQLVTANMNDFQRLPMTRAIQIVSL